jgi:hypothetical protein
MKGRLRSITLLVQGLTLAAGCSKAADLFQCPAQVDVRQQINVLPPGWSVVLDDLPHRLAGITFFDGKPEDKASLAPDNETKANGKSISTWIFSGGNRPVWVACRYAGTAVTLARELPKLIQACSLTYNLRQTLGGLPVIEKIDCK